MTHDASAKLSFELIGFLHTMDVPQRAAAVAEALGVPEPDAARALDALCEQGVVQRLGLDNDEATALTGLTALAEASEPTAPVDYTYIIHSPWREQPSVPRFTVQVMARKSTTLWDACTKLLERVLQNVRLLNADATADMEALYAILEQLRAHLADDESRTAYLRVLLQLLSTGRYTPVVSERAVPLVEWLLQRKGGDALPVGEQARLGAALTIFRYQIENIPEEPALFTPVPPEALCDPGEEPDSLSLLLSGCLYYINGEVKRVLELHERYSLRPLDDAPFWHDLFSMNASQAALHCRRFPLSMGIIESFRNTAEITGSSRQSLRWRLHLTFLLLHMDRLDEALTHIDQLMSAPQDSLGQPPVDITIRALALYHYKHGRKETAARILTEHAEQVHKNGKTVWPITDPGMLEMLYDLERHRGEPIPGYAVENEIRLRENNPNRLLRGVSLRLRGLLHRERHEHSLALDAFRSSFQALTQSGNSMECLRSGVELERALAEAQLHTEHLQLKEQLQRLSAEMAAERTADEVKDHSVTGVRCCLAALADMPGGGDASENLSRLTATIRRELSAQRVLLLRNTPDGGFEYAAASNLAPVELQGEKLKAVVHRLHTLHGQASPEHPILWQQHHQGVDTAVGLALYVTTRTPWLLYMDNSLGTGDFADLSADMACLFSTAVAAEIRGILRGQERTPRRVHPVRTARSLPPVFGEGLYAVLDDADRAARVPVSVLILGETGVGKELLARRIYERSGCAGPFVPVHLACISEHLFESELFGHEKGAFTGAIRTKIGLAEMARQGVLFLDEVGDMPMSFQIKLLRFLQEREFMRVGGVQRIRAEFRLITATNRDLREEVRQGRFREDLYYRLAVIPLRLPPLRERTKDIPLLAATFRDYFAELYGCSPVFPTDAQLAGLQNHPWPGNIRQLQSVVERAVVLERLDDENGENVSPPAASCPVSAAPCPVSAALPPAADTPLLSDEEPPTGSPTLEAVQRAYIRQVLKLTNGKIYGKDGAAAILGMKKSTLYNRLKELDDSSV